ncbi:hypothetical protein [Burkholderia stabilis]|uniref:hypothetical protein n=1 Tax=Burkholderia stabilis TaxID=95485 RepID=UPI001F4A2DEE|nr:hypothetical protein [Burkholderia stabilis]
MTALTRVTGFMQKLCAQKQRPHQMPPEGTLPSPLFPCRDRDAFCKADTFKLKGVREGVHEYKRRVNAAGWG